jgi:hypothetical protein
MSETKTKAPMTDIERKFARAFPKAKLVQIKLDRHLGGDKKSVYVGVNGHPFQVPTGKPMNVPEPLYEVLVRLEMQMEVIEGIRESIPNEG